MTGYSLGEEVEDDEDDDDDVRADDDDDDDDDNEEEKRGEGERLKDILLANHARLLMWVPVSYMTKQKYSIHSEHIAYIIKKVLFELNKVNKSENHDKN